MRGTVVFGPLADLEPDGGSGCYVSGNQVRRHSDRSIVAEFETHAEASRFYMDRPKLAARLDELALADKIQAELQQPPHVRFGRTKWTTKED